MPMSPGLPTMNEEFSIFLEWKQGFEFSIDFDQEGVAPLLTDEAPPLGEGSGPNPARLLAAAVGNCMSASLKYCLDRARIELLDLRVQVTGTIVRNDQGRLRIGALRVHLEPEVAAEDLGRLGRCVDIFEDFCTVGQSVRNGIDISVDVTPSSGVAAVVPGAPAEA